MNGNPHSFKSSIIDPAKVSSKHEAPEPATTRIPTPAEAMQLKIKLPWKRKVKTMTPDELTRGMFAKLEEYGHTRSAISEMYGFKNPPAFYSWLKKNGIPAKAPDATWTISRLSAVAPKDLPKVEVESPHVATAEEIEQFFAPVEDVKIFIPGVGPDAPVVVNEHGAKQSASGYLFTDFHPKSLLEVAAVSYKGREKYGPRNWEKIDQADHINHSLTHIVAYLAGDRQEPHLAHAICRLFFAMGTNQESR